MTEDESTATKGYTPRENPIETQAVTEFAGAIFVNVKDEPPTTELPDTGAGVERAIQSPAGMLVVIATLLGIGGCLLGTRSMRPGAR